MEIIKTNDYDILIEEGLFERLSEQLTTFDHKRRFFLVDSKVHRLYQSTINRVRADASNQVIVIRDGEPSKSFETYRNVIDKLLAKNIKRDDLLVALGGGVVGDLTGFIAATLFRGLDYIHVPTTLLSMVDSSIGGKTGINVPQGKNLIGAFHLPKKVFIDPLFLTTLPDEQRRSGLVETYKAALLGDAELLQRLRADEPLDEIIIKRAIDVKKRVVEQDPFDHGMRHILNFGHTFGHAIERKHNYHDITHGEAVGEGIVMALKIGVKLGLTPSTLYEEIKTLFIAKRLISEPLLDYRDFLHEIQTDKKIAKDGLKFVFLTDYQTPLIRTIDVAEL